MRMASKIQTEVGWAKVFLAFLREGETEVDQIRMRGMGIRWTPSATPHHGADLMQYFEILDSRKSQESAPARLAMAVGSRIARKV